MLERLARTMYRRRRRVLVAWIVALIGTFMLSGVHRWRVPHRVQAARHREPGRLRPAPAVELPRPPGPGPDRLQVRRRCHRSGRAERHGGSLRRDPVDDPQRHRREPLLTRGRSARSGPNNPNVAYAEVNFADRSNEAFQADGKKIKALGDQIDVPGPGDRLRRRHVRHEPDQRRHRGRRHSRRDDHPAARVRLGARDGPADRHRAVRHRHRYRDRAESCAPSSTCPTSPPRPSRWSASVSGSTTRCSSSRATARTWPRVSTRNAASCTPSTPPAARCCSPGRP